MKREERKERNLSQNSKKRTAYLGPTGTFSEEALIRAESDASVHISKRTIKDAVEAVSTGEVDRAFIPLENSIGGPVKETVYLFSENENELIISGEFKYQIDLCIAGAAPMRLEDIKVVLSHEQALAQCSIFLSKFLPEVKIIHIGSTALAMKKISKSPHDSLAAIASLTAVNKYGGTILERKISNKAMNITKFVWVEKSVSSRQEAR